MSSLTRFRMLLCTVLVLAGCAGVAHAQFGDLTKRVPGRANTLVLINVDQLMATPLATTEGWRGNQEKQFAAGLVMIPPQTSKFVLGAEMDLEHMQPIWQTMLLDVKYEPSIPKIAASLGGSVDNISDLSAAILPQDMYVVKFGPRFVGIAIPGSRQTVSRWINQIYGNTIQPLSPYLKEAVAFAESSSPVIMAMDLEGSFAPGFIRQRLEGLESLKNSNADLDQVAEVLASIRGVMLGIVVADKRYGKIKVDFKQDASILEPFARELLLEILTKRGAMIDEFKEWSVKVNGTQVTLQGYLYASGSRRIMSLLDAPPALQHQMQEAEATTDEEASEKMMAMASLQYFKSIVSMLDDLRGKRKSSDFTTWGQIGMWFEKYARKVDRMHILNVDPELLDYGKFVADSLRQSENAMKGIGARSGYRKTQMGNFSSGYGNYAYGGSYGNAYGGGGWGGYGTYGPANRAQAGNAMHTNMSLKFQAESKIRTQEKIQGNMQTNMIVQGVDAATADMRRKMTEKYQMEF